MVRKALIFLMFAALLVAACGEATTTLGGGGDGDIDLSGISVGDASQGDGGSAVGGAGGDAGGAGGDVDIVIGGGDGGSGSGGTAGGTGSGDAPDTTGLPVLRLAYLPVLNTMPLFVAQQENYFIDEGVNVQLVPFDSARDRQTALQAGDVDGAQTDLMGVVLLVVADEEIKAVRHDAFTEDYPYFAIQSSAGSGITQIEGLVGALGADSAQIAISNNTIIEYLTTEMLLSAGYTPAENDFVEIAQIPVRLESLLNNSVAAATLPEPLVTFADEIHNANTLIRDNDVQDVFVPTVIAFRQETLNANPAAVRAFLRAYERAVEELKRDPEKYRNVQIQVPDEIRDTYTIPEFVEARVPDEDEAKDVLDWMVDEELIPEVDRPDYFDIIDPNFIPDP